MGSGISGYVAPILDRVARLPRLILERRNICFALAVAFNLAVTVPLLCIFYDRSAPFTYVRVALVDKAPVQPGASVRVSFWIDNIQRLCSGEATRSFYVEGRLLSRIVIPTLYDRRVATEGPAGQSFEKVWPVPALPIDLAGAHTGLFITEPRFACNPFQWLLPIHVPRQTVEVALR